MRTQNQDSWNGNRPGGHHPPNHIRVQLGSTGHSAEIGPGILLTATVIAAAALLFSMVACASTSSAPGSAPFPTPSPLRWTPGATQNSAQTQGEPPSAATEAQLATATVLMEQDRRSKSIRRAYSDARRDAATGDWEIGNDFTARSPLDGPLTMLLDSEGATMMVSCAPAEEPRVSFIRSDAGHTSTSIELWFLEGDGTEARSLRWPRRNEPEWHEKPQYPTANWGTVVHHMNDDSQAIIDGLLLEGVAEMKARFKTGWTRHISERPDDNQHSFQVVGFPSVYEILVGYCRLTPVEIQATVASDALMASTPTPVPSPTLTLVPAKTWQQEWCREHNDPYISVDGHWHPLSGVEGTARLVVRCTGGVLTVGVHVIRDDGAYPQGEVRIAHAVQHGEGVEPYQRHEGGWQRVQGGSGEGLFITLPETAARDVVEVVYGPQFENSRALKLWVLFETGVENGLDPRAHDLSLGTDVVIPLRRLAVTHVLSADASAATPQFRPTTTSRLPEPTPLLTPTPTPTPTPTLPPPAPPSSLHLTAEFINVPTSHNGDAIQLWLYFSEAVSTSYKVLRDVAVQAQNATVIETKRWDGRSDLWRVTVEPDGADDVVITLTAPAGCDDEAAVCTESGKALSNSIAVRVPYGD